MSKLYPSAIASTAVFGPTPLTRHGAQRSQQRSIPLPAIELLIDFGEEAPAGNGCHRYYFTKRTWHVLAQQVGPQVKDLECYRSAYVVLGDNGHIVTVGWLH